MVRPHIRGCMEPGPECVEGELCETCGKTGAHDIIVLGRQETLEIIATMKNLRAHAKRSGLAEAVAATEVRP